MIIFNFNETFLQGDPDSPDIVLRCARLHNSAVFRLPRAVLPDHVRAASFRAVHQFVYDRYVQTVMRQVLAEFVTDVDAVGAEELNWPDIVVTHGKAKELLAATEAAVRPVGLTEGTLETLETLTKLLAEAQQEAGRWKQEAAVERELRRKFAATHRCKICEARWSQWEDGSWSLQSGSCGTCCNNAPMGEQIEPIGLTAELLRTVNERDDWRLKYSKEVGELEQLLRDNQIDGLKAAPAASAPDPEPPGYVLKKMLDTAFQQRDELKASVESLTKALNETRDKAIAQATRASRAEAELQNFATLVSRVKAPTPATPRFSALFSKSMLASPAPWYAAHLSGGGTALGLWVEGHGPRFHTVDRTTFMSWYDADFIASLVTQFPGLAAQYSDMLNALKATQGALAAARDGTEFKHDGCSLTLEEVKYTIIDPLLEQIENDNNT